MAGFFTKNNGYVFNGEDMAVAAQDLKSGLFVEIDAGKVKPAGATALAGYTFKVVEVTEYNGAPAVRADVLTVGDEEVFMTEVVDTNIGGVDMYGEYVAKEGAYVRKRRPQIGDQICVNVDASVTVNIGDKLVIEADTGALIKSA